MSNFVTTKVQWVPYLLVAGVLANCPERLPGAFDTSAQAMATAEAAIKQRPDAIGVSVKRVEVHQ